MGKQYNKGEKRKSAATPTSNAKKPPSKKEARPGPQRLTQESAFQTAAMALSLVYDGPSANG
jgi:hypothetical protein